MSEMQASQPKMVPAFPSLEQRYLYTQDSEALIFVMVGLPARGKSFVSMRLARFLNWLLSTDYVSAHPAEDKAVECSSAEDSIGPCARVFNVGNNRRQTDTGTQDASYFDSSNAAAAERREELAMQTCREMLSWVCEDEIAQQTGVAADACTADPPAKCRKIEASVMQQRPRQSRFGIFDATNTTRKRRAKLCQTLFSFSQNLGVIFIESLCTDPHVLEANIEQKLQKSPDYRAQNRAEARADLLQRIKLYERVYEPLDEPLGTEDEVMVKVDDVERAGTQVGGGEMATTKLRLSYMKLLNFSSHVVAHNIYGRTAKDVLPYLMAIHVGSRPIWLVRQPKSAKERNVNFADFPHVNFAEHQLSEDAIGWVKDTLGSTLTRKLKKMSVAGGPLASRVEGKSLPSGLVIHSCTHRRSVQTAELLQKQLRANGSEAEIRTCAALNPMERGSLNGVTAAAPLLENLCKVGGPGADLNKTRFAGGESISDVRYRVLSTLIEIEQDMRPSVIIGPLSVLQVLLCYYRGQSSVGRNVFDEKIPMHSLVEVCPDGANFTVNCWDSAELSKQIARALLDSCEAH